MKTKITNRIIWTADEGHDNGGATPPPATEPPAPPHHEEPPAPPATTEPHETERNELHRTVDSLGEAVRSMQAQLAELTAAPPAKTDPTPAKKPWTHRGFKK